MIFTGNGIVWNHENDKALAIFKDGEFRTNDKIVQEKLISYGFEGELEEGEEHEESDEKQTKGKKDK